LVAVWGLNGLVSQSTLFEKIDLLIKWHPGKPTPPTRFALANVLIGRLMLYDEKRFDYRLEILWTLRDALEYPIRDDSDRQQLARLYRAVPAAVKLIETIGQKIYQWCYEPQDKPQEDPRPGVPLWKGQRGFCMGRWEFWHKRFLDLSDESTLDGEEREGASKAARAMSDVSRNTCISLAG
jgi:hypothetical protein